MMGTCSYLLLSNCCFSSLSISNDSAKFYNNQIVGNSLFRKPIYCDFHKQHQYSVIVRVSMEDTVKTELQEENRRGFRWVEVGHDITEAQKQAISQLPFKMEKLCKALMRQIICFSPEKGNISDLLGAWVRIMKPIRADWLSVLKELKTMDHPLYLQVAEHALVEESFEANARDYTKIIHYYGKQSRLQDAENLLTVMKQRGFICDQVTLTAMVHMYSKADHLEKAKEYFQEIRLLGEPLDPRSYGSMIMAYIRAGMPQQGEILLKEMDAQEIHAGSEVYKALLRTCSMVGDTKGAERIFDAIQLAGICPDDKMCGLVINAYGTAGQSRKARIAFENMRRAGIEASDKCIALVLVAYEKENKLNEALEFLIDLERDGIVVQKEASEILAQWFRKLGVVEEVELLLRDFVGREARVNHASRRKNLFLTPGLLRGKQGGKMEDDQVSERKARLAPKSSLKTKSHQLRSSFKHGKQGGKREDDQVSKRKTRLAPKSSLKTKSYQLRSSFKHGKQGGKREDDQVSEQKTRLAPKSSLKTKSHKLQSSFKHGKVSSHQKWRQVQKLRGTEKLWDKKDPYKQSK